MTKKRNFQRRFVFLAAMAAVLVILAGGANALAIAGYRVLCVPNHTINPSCTATDYATIQAAVTAANAGDTVLVAAGTWNESVTIDETGHSRDGLSLLGAQAGNDARVDRHNSNKESIVIATGTGNTAITVMAKLVVVDGFTVQSATNWAGIDLKGSCYPTCSPGYPADGSVVVNNIIQNSTVGVALNGGAYGTLTGALVEHNLFKNNTAGGLEGVGIAGTAVNLASITENAFTGNKSAAMEIYQSNHVTITDNTSEKDGSFVVFNRTTNSQFSNNRGEDFGAKGVLPGHGDAAVAIVIGNNGLVISDNCLEEGKDPISNGIAFTFVASQPPNTNIYVKNNRIKRFPGTGILAETGMLRLSLILGNEVEDNGLDGIYIDDFSGNVGNSLFDNEAEGNHRFDCHDDTSGAGTAGTGNAWFHNTGKLMYPTGLCTPEKRHDRD